MVANISGRTSLTRMLPKPSDQVRPQASQSTLQAFGFEHKCSNLEASRILQAKRAQNTCIHLLQLRSERQIMKPAEHSNPLVHAPSLESSYFHGLGPLSFTFDALLLFGWIFVVFGSSLLVECCPRLACFAANRPTNRQHNGAQTLAPRISLYMAFM